MGGRCSWHALTACPPQTTHSSHLHRANRPFPRPFRALKPPNSPGSTRGVVGDDAGDLGSKTQRADPRVGPGPAVVVRPLLRDRAPAARPKTAVSVSQPTFHNSSPNESAQGVL